MNIQNVEQAVNSSPRRLAAKVLLVVSLVSLAAGAAQAADANNGKRIAKASCAACHIVEAPPMVRREVAEAPPFIAIAKKFNFNADMLVFDLIEVHPKMNFALTRPEANDVAAYMSTLGKK